MRPLLPPCNEFEESLGPVEVGHTHNNRGPSSTVQCKGLVGAGRDTGDEHTCPVVLDATGEDGCGIAEAIHSKSSEVAHKTSI